MLVPGPVVSDYITVYDYFEKKAYVGIDFNSLENRSCLKKWILVQGQSGRDI